ncbi:hypothetical protein GA0070216_111204 [Micromonospora matsumotoense]|uniref:Flavin reductase n=1 Tax=Micromonospora matsumotoense TaxID=121616 RepID=A0A1C4ZWP5_9ACTN|nr:hypothetical protein GA0070216_111204 [Micromonospora matsumotoense]
MNSRSFPVPRLGPYADRPRAHPPRAHPPRAHPPGGRPHLPLRPLWVCRACGGPWPCAEGRLLLRIEYDAHLVDLAVYLSGRSITRRAMTCSG